MRGARSTVSPFCPSACSRELDQHPPGQAAQLCSIALFSTWNASGSRCEGRRRSTQSASERRVAGPIGRQWLAWFSRAAAVPGFKMSQLIRVSSSFRLSLPEVRALIGRQTWRADMKSQSRDRILRMVGKCLKRAHEAERQHRPEKAKRYAAVSQKLLESLERLRQQARP
jgi:hypothetical protein